MHVVGTLVLDTATIDEPFTMDRVRNLVLERLHLMPVLRRRMLQVPLGIDHPMWIEDPDFSVDNHLRRVTIPAPGGPRELADVVGDIASTPLDRRRPLWQMNLVDGLADGQTALVTKIHHTIIDGETGTDLMAYLLDLEPEPAPVEPPTEPWQPDVIPTDTQLAADAVVSRVKDPLRLVRGVLNSASSVIGVARGALGGGDDRLHPALPFSGPRTPLNAPITARRSVAFGQVRLDDLRHIKSTFGTTVNDVVLAASASALRRWLLVHDDLPERPLVAAVPVSVHTQDGAGTNQVSNMFVRLPVDIDDPVASLLRIQAETRDAKAVHSAMGADLIQELAQITPPGIYNLGLRLYAQSGMDAVLPPVQNLVISNVPGPPIPLYLAGARVSAMYPFGPLIEGSGINLTVLSNMGSVDVGVIACPDTVPDLWQIPEAFVAAVHDLRDAADRALEDRAAADGSVSTN
jgi:WS/DGAT/MGAT family acyltransferase